MISIKRILCPVDMSAFSRRALCHAAALGRWYEGTVTALCIRPTILQPTPWMYAPMAMPLETPADREAAARDVVEFVRSAVGLDVADVVVKDGFVVPEILAFAAEWPADLIVIGTHGAGGFERLMLGSVTEKVLRRARCPVLTVPRDASSEASVAFKTIVCGVDFSAASVRAARYALSLAQEAGGRLVLVNVQEFLPEDEPRALSHFNVPEFRAALEQDARVELAALVPEDARPWCEPQFVISHGKAYAEILRVAAEQQAQLIVLGVQGRGAVDLMLFGSTTQHVVRQATCPVLTVPALPAAAVAAA